MRPLVHLDHLVDVREPFDLLEWHGLGLAAVEMLAEDRIQGVPDQRALTASAHTGHADEGS